MRYVRPGRSYQVGPTWYVLPGRSYLLAALLAACGSKGKAKDAAPVAEASDGGVRKADGGVRVSDGGTGGTVRVKVEWKDAPAAVRASPGRDGCGEERPGFASVHTLHGVGDVVVWIDGETGGAVGEAAVVGVEKCRSGPAVQIGAGEVRVKSLVEERKGVEVRWGEDLEQEPEQIEAAFALPVIGHTAAVAARPGVWKVTAEGVVDASYVVVPAGPHAAVTDETGAATLKGIGAGDHEVVAWLHGGAGQEARVARGAVTVKEGEAVDVTLSLVPGATGANGANGGSGEPEPEPE